MSNYSYLVEEAKNDGISRFVVGAVVSSTSKVLLLKRPKNDFMGGIYELPSGKVEEGESLDDALSREVIEETGIVITEIKNYLGYFDYESKTGRKTRQFNFLVVGQEPIEIILQEHDEYVWVSPSQFDSYPVTDSVKETIGQIIK